MDVVAGIDKIGAPDARPFQRDRNGYSVCERD
jgi:hypothetical protein